MCSLQGQEPVVFPALPESKGERGKRGGGGGDIGRTERHWVWGGNPHRERETRGKGGGGVEWRPSCAYIWLWLARKRGWWWDRRQRGFYFWHFWGYRVIDLFFLLFFEFFLASIQFIHISNLKNQLLFFFRQTGRQLKVLCHHFIFYFLSPSYLYFFCTYGLSMPCLTQCWLSSIESYTVSGYSILIGCKVSIPENGHLVVPVKLSVFHSKLMRWLWTHRH